MGEQCELDVNGFEVNEAAETRFIHRDSKTKVYGVKMQLPSHDVHGWSVH